MWQPEGKQCCAGCPASVAGSDLWHALSIAWHVWPYMSDACREVCPWRRQQCCSSAHRCPLLSVSVCAGTRPSPWSSPSCSTPASTFPGSPSASSRYHCCWAIYLHHIAHIDTMQICPAILFPGKLLPLSSLLGSCLMVYAKSGEVLPNRHLRWKVQRCNVFLSRWFGFRLSDEKQNSGRSAAHKLQPALEAQQIFFPSKTSGTDCSMRSKWICTVLQKPRPQVIHNSEKKKIFVFSLYINAALVRVRHILFFYNMRHLHLLVCEEEKIIYNLSLIRYL